MEDKYYFISYYRITAYGNTINEDVIFGHPFKEMKALRKKYKECSFSMINYKEITKEEYDYYLNN